MTLLPDGAPAFTKLALLYDAQGNFVQARRNYERTIMIDLRNPLALDQPVLRAYRNQRDLDQTRKYTRSAQQQLPNFKGVDDTNRLDLSEEGHDRRRGRRLKILVDGMPVNPEYHYHYALPLYQKGNQQEAFLQAKTAEDNMPRPELEKQIRDLIDKFAYYRNAGEH